MLKRYIKLIIVTLIVATIFLIGITYFMRPDEIDGSTKDIFPKLIESLIENLKDEDPEVRNSAARQLWNMGPRAAPALPALIESIEDPDEWVRVWSVRAIQMLKPEAEDVVGPLIEALGQKSYYVRDASEEALREIGEPAIPALLDAIESEDSLVRAGVIRALRLMPWQSSPYAVQVFDALMKSLDDEHYAVRSNAVFAVRIYKYKPDIVVPKLTTMLIDEADSVRNAVARALRVYGVQAASALDGLLKLLEDEENKDVRSEAFRAIGYLGPVSKSAAPELLEQLDSPDRIALIGTLSRIGPEPGVLPALLKILKEGDERSRYAVVYTMDQLGPLPEVIDALINAIEDESPDVQRGAIRSLGELGSGAKDALPVLKELSEETDDKRFRWALLDAIEEIESDLH